MALSLLWRTVSPALPGQIGRPSRPWSHRYALSTREPRPVVVRRRRAWVHRLIGEPDRKAKTKNAGAIDFSDPHTDCFFLAYAAGSKRGKSILLLSPACDG